MPLLLNGKTHKLTQLYRFDYIPARLELIERDEASDS